MRRMIPFMHLVAVLLLSVDAFAQDFSQTASAVPQHTIMFKLKTPIVHLSMARYAPSATTVLPGNTTIWFSTQPASSLYLKVRWDLDESDGVTFGDWYENQDAPAAVTAHYDTPGVKVITVQLRLSNDVGQQQEDTKRIEITVVPSPAGRYVDYWGNSLTYWPGNDGIYDKPLVVVEGFDPTNEEDALDQYAAGAALADTARAAGYDLLFLNFADGGAHIGNNKDVFLGACRFAHDKLLGEDAGVQVVGLSMGGMIARYGLAYAEDRMWNGQEADHFVNTFISFDAPQQGVHLNRTLEDLLQLHGSPAQVKTLSSSAARELLYDDPYGSLHDDLQNSLRAYLSADGVNRGGYPRLSRNFALSNGTYRPVRTDKTPGVDLLANLVIYKSLVAGFLDVDMLQVDEAHPIPCEARDLWPGSTFPRDLRSINTMASRSASPFPFPFNMLLSGYGDIVFQVFFNPSYQPTEAALDLSGYIRLHDGTLAGGRSAFDDTLTQAQTHRHEEVTDDSKRTIMRWLAENRTHAYLTTPRNVRAFVTEDNAVSVSFNDLSSNNDLVSVERKPEGGSFAAIGSAPPEAAAYIDRDPALQPYARYVYRVRSVSGARTSRYSAEAAVVYQPHLQSSSAAALGAGNQRRALQTTAPTNNRFLAYESGAGSYLVRFINDDVESGTWERERPIGGTPPPGVEMRSPSLFCDSTGAEARVVYDEVTTATGLHTLRLAVFNELAQELIAYGATIGAVSGSASFATMPVAAMTTAARNKPPALIAAAWRSELNSTLSLALGVHGADGRPTFTSVDLNAGVFTGPVTHATHPSIAAVLNSAGNPAAYHVYLAWEEEDHGATSGGIRLVHGRYTPGAQPMPPVTAQIVWESAQPFVVAQNGATETHRRPAVVVDSLGSVVIAWETVSGTSAKVQFQKRSWLTSSVVTTPSATIVSGSGTSAPHGLSLADKRGVPGSGGDLIAAWTTDAGGAHAAWYGAALGAWSTPRQLDAAARAISLAAAKGPSSESRVAAMTALGGTPYAIRATTTGLLPPPPPAPQLSWQTVLVNGVKRPKLAWSAVGPDLQGYDVYLYTCEAGAPDCGASAFHALQASTAALTWTDLNTIVFTKSATNTAPDRTNYYYVRGRDRFSQSGAPSPHIAVNTEENFAWKGAPGDASVPTAYALGEGFPNPFNPSTTLRYELPASGRVRLTVFNLLGEEVATLADLRQDPGRYEAVWDASGSPSGVYVALLRVTGDAGELAYAASRKVILLR